MGGSRKVRGHDLGGLGGRAGGLRGRDADARAAFSSAITVAAFLGLLLFPLFPFIRLAALPAFAATVIVPAVPFGH